jgi:hypothetical protein
MEARDLFEHRMSVLAGGPFPLEKGVSLEIHETNTGLYFPLFFKNELVVLPPLVPYGQNLTRHQYFGDGSCAVYYASEGRVNDEGRPEKRFRVVVDKNFFSSDHQMTFRTNYGVLEDGRLDDISLKYWIYDKGSNPRLTGSERVFPDGRLRAFFPLGQGYSYCSDNFVSAVDLLINDERFDYRLNELNEVRFQATAPGHTPASLVVDVYMKASIRGESFVIESTEDDDGFHRVQLKLERRLDFANSFANLAALMRRFYPQRADELFGKVASLDYLVFR